MLLRNAILKFEIEINASLIPAVLRRIVNMIQLNFIFAEVVIKSIQVSIVDVSPSRVCIEWTAYRITVGGEPCISHPTFFFKIPI